MICFFGDGAVNQGTFHESLNMAALWNLPVLFVCENNHYQIGTEIHRHSAVTEVYKRACGYDIPARKIDGMDVMAVYSASKDTLAQIHAGNGPQFIEFSTYRFRGHSMADPGSYRPRVEVQAYKNTQDPVKIVIAETVASYPTPDQIAAAGSDNIERLREHLNMAGHLSIEQLENMKIEINEVVEAAIRFAKDSAEPTFDDAQAALNCNRHGELLI